MSIEFVLTLLFYIAIGFYLLVAQAPWSRWIAGAAAILLALALFVQAI